MKDYGLGEEAVDKIVKQLEDHGMTQLDVYKRQDSGRVISLLPTTHIAVLYTDTINPRMTQTMEHLAERYHNDPAKFPTNICLISGPSRTADIELVTVDGAHGPIQVTYILVNR